MLQNCTEHRLPELYRMIFSFTDDELQIETALFDGLDASDIDLSDGDDEDNDPNYLPNPDPGQQFDSSNDSSDDEQEEVSIDETTSSQPESRNTWRRRGFIPPDPPLLDSTTRNDTEGWDPLDYFSQYVDNALFEL
ncbi:uncharacterized protein LOC120350513 [Nilaparvata lugens]|uniref:uncharacterized protein LOC120350513 n=1 Tax=Nilaparvata lugens TaxID=108931 RepID=UPI00193C95E5|nr:uncharacterized protein LOC120350513 [Nilaparvata lugens]